MLFVATHWYNPLSEGLTFLMVRLPPFTSVFAAGKGISNLVQLKVGCGKPSASQISCTVANCLGVASNWGALVKIGRPMRKK